MAKHLLPMPKPASKSTADRQGWSQRVSANSHALDLSPGVFGLNDPRQVALALKQSAEASTRRKAEPFRSAMSMLNFYLNRAGRRLPAQRRRCLEAAKDELRALYGKPRQGRKLPPRAAASRHR